jgi:KUP system potassium uptake protein
MEAAYGLAITLTMLMTSILLFFYLRRVRLKKRVVWPIIVMFFGIEISFLIANLQKFSHGGWFSLLISGILIIIMGVWYRARKIKNKFTEFVLIDTYLPMLSDLSADESVPKFASHLVYLSSADRMGEIESKIMYSIFNKQPKRADMYWFVHVDVLDEPYTKEYEVNVLVKDTVIRIDFKLGFRIEPKINIFVRKVIEDLTQNHEIDIVSRYHSLRKHGITGDFKFVVNKRVFTYDSELGMFERLVMKVYAIIDSLALSEEKAFSLDTSNVIVEKVPLSTPKTKGLYLKRIKN